MFVRVKFWFQIDKFTSLSHSFLKKSPILSNTKSLTKRKTYRMVFCQSEVDISNPKFLSDFPQYRTFYAKFASIDLGNVCVRLYLTLLYSKPFLKSYLLNQEAAKVSTYYIRLAHIQKIKLFGSQSSPAKRCYHHQNKFTTFSILRTHAPSPSPPFRHSNIH